MQVVQFEFERGNKIIIQIETKIKMEGFEKFEARTKYAFLGGMIACKLLLKLDNGVFNFKNTDIAHRETVEMTAKYVEGKSLQIEGKNNGESMWTYKAQRTTVSNNAKFEMTLNTLNTLEHSIQETTK